MKYTDSHCHLDFDAFANTLPELISKCASFGVHQIIVPAITPENWSAVLNLSKLSFDNKKLSCKICPCLGIHPWFLTELTLHHLEALAQLVNQHHQNIVAIGETGIDVTISDQQNNLSKQIDFFTFQLHLAEQYQLPVVVHHRRSHGVILPILKNLKLSKAGVIHAFSGSYQEAMAYIDLGFKLGVGGTISYPRAKKTINTIARLPLSSLLIETDAPAMPLYQQQGEPNSPLQLVNVFNCLSAIRSESPEIIAQALENNVRAVFSL